jgi:drug/metabolite transporter (DMT)-like permease
MANRAEPSPPPEREAGTTQASTRAPASAAAPVQLRRPTDAERTRARALLFGASVFFGLSAVLVRLATRGGMNGGQVTLVRFLVGLGGVGAIFLGRPGTFRPVNRPLLVSRGAFGAASALLYFLAIERIPAGQATLLNNTFPIWAVLLSLFVLDERPTFHLGLALAIASAGVFLVLGGDHLTLELGTGQVLALVSAITGGVAVTSMRRLRATDNAPTIFFAFAVGGILAGLPFAAGGWPSSPSAWLAAGAVGIAAFFAQLLMTEAYGALSVPEAALWQQLTPIASYLWALTLGEGISWSTAAGVLLGVAGVVYGSVLGHRPRHDRSPEAEMAKGIPLEEP